MKRKKLATGGASWQKGADVKEKTTESTQELADGGEAEDEVEGLWKTRVGEKVDRG